MFCELIKYSLCVIFQEKFTRGKKTCKAENLPNLI